MVTMGDGFTDCSVGISKVLKHQQHAYLVSQVTNKLDLYKLKLETKMDKIKLWELDEGSSNANSTEFKIIKQLSTSLIIMIAAMEWKRSAATAVEQAVNEVILSIGWFPRDPMITSCLLSGEGSF